ncbi:MAG: AzlD domain-containing protein [Actinomycetota bacterium]|nr:AzlD domain-containing protein [Actinomycetota bacterium]
MTKPTVTYLIEAIAVASMVTFSLRALPFLIKGFVLRQRVVLGVRAAMPYGIVTILAVYAITSTKVTSVQIALAETIAVAVTIALHLLRRNVLLSIFGGTLLYVVAVNLPLSRL